MAFTGHERDGNAAGTVDDLDYMHQRYYSPQMGRFLSTDPINSANPRRPGSWNKYAYAGNSPVVMVDPDGRAFGLFGKVAKVAAKGGDVAGTIAGAVEDLQTLTASDSSLGDRAVAALSLTSEVASPVSLRDVKAGATVGVAVVEGMAKKLFKRFGKGRATGRTAGGKRIDIDLQGDPHFDKRTGQDINTPHVHEAQLNVGQTAR